jgi:periplasmic divalent cation tolerance protein
MVPILMKQTAGNVLIVFTTVPKQSEAVRMSEVLVKKKIAACATVFPGISSFYKWNGKMVHGREVLIMFKTASKRYLALEKAIKALHPYEVPEILAVRATRGYLPYLEWVSSEVRD